MCAPGEYHLARLAGWSDPFAYGMPVVLSAYAGIAAAVASARRAGEPGRWSAIVGAGLALVLAIAAQVVSHLIGTGHAPADTPVLVAATSLVPPAVVGHLLHLAAMPAVPEQPPVLAAVPASERVRPAPRTRTRAVPAAPGTPDPLTARVRQEYADGYPSVRELKTRYSIGQARAQRIRDGLATAG